MKKILTFLVLAFFPIQILAITDLVVVSHPASGIDKMTRDDVTSVYMGRSKKLSSGLVVLPVDLSSENGEKARFYRELINKEIPEVNSYWARLIFSGQGSPPRQADNIKDVIDIVSSNKGAIGYLPRAAVDKRIRVILDLSIP